MCACVHLREWERKNAQPVGSNCFVFLHWCHVEFCLCCLRDVRLHQVYVCVCIDTRLSKQAIFLAREKVHTAKCIPEKITTEHRFCRPPYLLLVSEFTCRSRALSGLCWEGLFFFLLLHLATLWCKWKKKVNLTKKTDLPIMCCFFGQTEPSMPLHTNY